MKHNNNTGDNWIYPESKIPTGILKTQEAFWLSNWSNYLWKYNLKSDSPEKVKLTNDANIIDIQYDEVSKKYYYLSNKGDINVILTGEHPSNPGSFKSLDLGIEPSSFVVWSSKNKIVFIGVDRGLYVYDLVTNNTEKISLQDESYSKIENSSNNNQIVLNNGDGKAYMFNIFHIDDPNKTNWRVLDLLPNEDVLGISNDSSVIIIQKNIIQNKLLNSIYVSDAIGSRRKIIEGPFNWGGLLDDYLILLTIDNRIIKVFLK